MPNEQVEEGNFVLPLPFLLNQRLLVLNEDKK